ncbi:hypothetical protein LCGC14_1787340 [marine sediment metagenome]|uniref:Uncharacterized protein n=1 Tax=marine sediment metagenome TaxID=412755 RepID=A0A0F9HG54_9ZZZZ
MDDIPKFSPYGYGWEYKNMKDYIKELESDLI